MRNYFRMTDTCSTWVRLFVILCSKRYIFIKKKSLHIKATKMFFCFVMLGCSQTITVHNSIHTRVWWFYYISRYIWKNDEKDFFKESYRCSSCKLQLFMRVVSDFCLITGWLHCHTFWFKMIFLSLSNFFQPQGINLKEFTGLQSTDWRINFF